MAETITMYHSELKETTEARSENQARVLEKSGWSREVPKKYQDDEKKEA
jgi:hypothetical protein